MTAERVRADRHRRGAGADRRRALLGSQLAAAGVVALIASCLVRRQRTPVLTGALALVAVGAGVGLPPLVVDAYPTTYKRPLLTYHAASIASGMTIYGEHCAGCHGASGAGVPHADLRSAPTSRRHAGELFWLVSRGIPGRGMPDFGSRLGAAQRWDVINFIRTLGAADAAKTIGHQVEPDRAWLAAPDFTVAVGPLAPGALRDDRGRRMVLLVLYTLPESRARLTELARGYDVLSVLGVEVIAVPTHASSEAIRELGSPASSPASMRWAENLTASLSCRAWTGSGSPGSCSSPRSTSASRTAAGSPDRSPGPSGGTPS